MNASKEANDTIEKFCGKDRNFKYKLIKLAEDDSQTSALGLDLVLHPVSDWAKIPDLRAIRKYRAGSHRVYISGKHTECFYRIGFVMPFKKDKDDKPERQSFQKRVLKAFGSTPDVVYFSGISAAPPALEPED